ncbi:MAG TPA: DNA primase [Dehalococcoidia bacterium]
MNDVEEIKQRVDIVDLVSGYVTLKRAGKGFTALCPFHTEKTPSFHVDPSRQSWHCFGACSTGGDIFGFVMKKENCDFREALRLLAERAGVALETHRNVQEDARRGRLFEVNEAAALYFQTALQQTEGAHGAGAEAARAYLAERRLSPGAVETFQLGYAPNSWEALTSYLSGRGYEEREIVSAGLAIEGERNAYDRFRHRLMFPIRDDRGRVSGFGGRLLPGEALGSGDAQPKYVNTSQSPIFDKGAILYALDLAKDAIRTEGCAVIVEGYMDVIAAHEHGFANVVASMGTALTERQVGLLKRHTRNLILALDADAAGSEATLRGVQVVADAVDREMEPSVNWRGVVRMQETVAADIRVLTMPLGRDPDDVIRDDPDAWPRLVAEAKPVLDYLFDAAVARHDAATPRGRSAVASDLLPMIAAVGDRVVQSHYMQRLARIAQVDEATLRLDMRAPQRKAAAIEQTPIRGAGVRDKKEEFCLALLFRYPELRAEGEALEPSLFDRSENRALFETWIDRTNEGEPFEGALAPDLRSQFERVVNLDLPSYDDDALVKALRSTVWGIEQQRLRYAKRASAAVLADLPVDDSAHVAERAHIAWQTGGAVDHETAEDEADPATAFVEDMEVGLKVHQRLLQRRRDTEHPAR